MPDELFRQPLMVDVEGGEWDKRVKLKWRKTNPFTAAYSVPFGMLREASDRVRQRLEALVGESMRGNVMHSGAILKEIAEAGHRLYRALFHDPGGVGAATKNRQKIETLTGPHQLYASTTGGLHIPWGLVYDGDPEELSGNPEDVAFEHYQGFWCIKYRASCVYNKVETYSADKPLPAGMVRMQSVVNELVYERTRPYLEKCGAPFWDWLTTQFGPPIYSQKNWLARWKSEYDKVAVLYFYSHANGGKIGLASDSISANDLALDLGDETAVTLPCVVFVNGCSTAVGDPNGGFLEATAGSRFCGFIGAEASIPEIFALRFGSAFLYEFFRGGRTIIDIMAGMRECHWPLSLLYNVYCVPELKLEAANAAPPAVPVGNFCSFDLGTQGI
jgi:hypothetical protein